MKIYRLAVDKTIEYEYDREDLYYFFTKEAREVKQEELKQQYIREDGSYLPNITSLHFYDSEYEFEQLKDEMTIEQFEGLFGVNVNALISAYVNADKEKNNG
jgi:hypothetical protein